MACDTNDIRVRAVYRVPTEAYDDIARSGSVSVGKIKEYLSDHPEFRSR